MHRQKRGKYGEKIAIYYLLNKGHQILITNFHSKYGEIDIITKYKDGIYIYEVKLRKTLRYGYGDQSITKRKIDKIIKTFETWLEQNAQYISYPKYINALVIDPDGSIYEFEI